MKGEQLKIKEKKKGQLRESVCLHNKEYIFFSMIIIYGHSPPSVITIYVQ